jgi:hypothetical protein
MRSTRALFVALVAFAAACGGGAPDARYPAREPGCAVKAFAGESLMKVDNLGTVTVECAAGEKCERKLLDAVCARGGDIAWGLGENALTATTMKAHAAHSAKATKGPREQGCAVQVFKTDAPLMPTENIGPVTVKCTADDSDDTCMRLLQDQVCALGGDVLWQVDGPTMKDDGKKHARGRAAHTK